MDVRNRRLRIEEIEDELKQLPKGKVFLKKIKGKEQPYLQWSENGKARTRYVKTGERQDIYRQLAYRDELLQELKQLSVMEEEHTRYYTGFRFHTNAVYGSALDDLISGVRKYQKRECYEKLERYLHSDTNGKVCVLYGLRRTGKTTLLFQLIDHLSEEEREKAVYIKLRTADTMSSLTADLKSLSANGFRYAFLDEVTLMEDFIDSASILSDIYAMQGMKIILSGTDSLGFWLAEGNELYDRAYLIHTTFIPFREYSRLLGIDDIDEYIRYGGTLMPGETDFDDPDALDETSAFRDDESARKYIDTAICKNIQHSLACFRGGDHFRHLMSLYDAGELTSAINRTIESMNHQFLVRTLISKFKSHDLGSAAQLLNKERDPEKQTDILDRIDREAVTAKLMAMLEIRNQEDSKIGITREHVAEISEYLKALDLVVDCPSETTILNAEPAGYVLFTQPGMRYCQAQVLVHVLMKDEVFSSFSEREKTIAAEKILEDVRGRMMEDIVLLETMKCLPKNKRAFKLYLSRREFNMAVYDRQTDTLEEYEVKHSTKRVPEQTRTMLDDELNREVTAKYGHVSKRCVIYRGESCHESQIEYLNVQEYLKSL